MFKYLKELKVISEWAIFVHDTAIMAVRMTQDFSETTGFCTTSTCYSHFNQCQTATMKYN